ncbi:DNA replication/repair protein RecF [Phycicoccus flavus]|uniref:DNA replication/repair protein RecF n=1 Tax=Phycicoccus flavus TaxID=2502783 RepID=UPI00197C0A0D|nr:DNA replication/repair protein RecF [Phycicoccus flavus]
MHVRHLSVADFRSYPSAELPLGPGVTTLVGLNGQGKTNLAEALGYLASLSSHRVATDAPLVRFGAERAVVRGAVVSRGRETMVELEITPGKANRARLNRSPVRPREVLGSLRTVLFAPEDLALVKGDPGERRRFLDDLLVARQPRWAGVRQEYDRIVKQRSALLKSAQPHLSRRARGRRPRPGSETLDPASEAASALHTLSVWDDQLATVGSQLLYARLRLLRDLGPYLSKAYDEVSAGQSDARVAYRSSLREATAARLADGDVLEIAELREEVLASLAEVRDAEVERGVCLVGPHRDDVVLTLGELPAKGYASHGESWSFALGLRLAAFQLLRTDLQDDPVLVLDDVFAELDSGRRERLAAMVGDAEQVLVTAAVPEDVPAALAGRTYRVRLGRLESPTFSPDPGTFGFAGEPNPGEPEGSPANPADAPDVPGAADEHRADDTAVDDGAVDDAGADVGPGVDEAGADDEQARDG